MKKSNVKKSYDNNFPKEEYASNTIEVQTADTNDKFHNYKLYQLCEIAFLSGSMVSEGLLDFKKYGTIEEMYEFVYYSILEEWENGIKNGVFLYKEEEGYIDNYAQRRLVELYGNKLSFKRGTDFTSLDIDKSYIFDVQFNVNTKFVTHKNGGVYYLNYIGAVQRERNGVIDIYFSVADNDAWVDCEQHDIKNFDNAEDMKSQIIDFLNRNRELIEYTDEERGIKESRTFIGFDNFDKIKKHMIYYPNNFSDNEVMFSITGKNLGVKLIYQVDNETDSGFFSYAIIKDKGCEWFPIRYLTFKQEDINNVETLKHVMTTLLDYFIYKRD